jgi:hypothetical protein
VGKTVHSRSGKNLPRTVRRRSLIGRRWLGSGNRGCLCGRLPRRLDLGFGTVTRTLQERSKSM